MQRPLLIGVGVSLAVATGASAERDIRLTVYNDNLGLVSEQREIEATKGEGAVEIVDVPALIDPTSVHLNPKAGGLQVLEQNFQYDLAGPDRILDRFLGEAVEVILKEGEVKTGRLLSYQGGTVVLQDAGGAVSLVLRSEIVDLRLPELPEGLRTRPTLVWRLASEKSGSAPVELSYLTEGMRWHAEYVAVANEKDTEIELSAWVSLENNSGATFPNARLQLIAGDVQRVQPPQPSFDMMRAGAMMAEKAMVVEESFFEYHLYTVERRTTIADRETKQIALFPATSAPVEKIYEYNGQRDATKVSVVLETENRDDRGLGMPLPAGKIRAYKKDGRGQLQFIGEDAIDHTPRNEKVRLRVGKAFDVVGERTELSQKRISDRVWEQEIEIKLRNRKEESISVLVEENFWGDWEVLQSTSPATKKDARTAEFRLPVPADGETVLRFTVRNRN